jgi:acyl CoA:acetate/3-ketoacid CoA transferase alpha subunit
MRGEECVMCTYPCSSQRYDTQVEEIQSILHKSQNQQVSSSSSAAAEGLRIIIVPQKMGTHEKEKLGQDSCMTSFRSMHVLPPSSPESLPMVSTHL